MTALTQPLVRQPAAVIVTDAPLDYSYVFGNRGSVERHDPQVRQQTVQSPVDLRLISDLLRNRTSAT